MQRLLQGHLDGRWAARSGEGETHGDRPRSALRPPPPTSRTPSCARRRARHCRAQKHGLAARQSRESSVRGGESAPPEGSGTGVGRAAEESVTRVRGRSMEGGKGWPHHWTSLPATKEEVSRHSDAALPAERANTSGMAAREARAEERARDRGGFAGSEAGSRTFDAAAEGPCFFAESRTSTGRVRARAGWRLSLPTGPRSSGKDV